jgi:hypothetical protein
VWRYSDLGVPLEAAWREPTFDDAAWAMGLAPLGYAHSLVATKVSFGPNSNAKHMTTYFRRTFDVGVDRGLGATLGLKLLRDGGAVVYLNGAEVARSNMPSGAITWATEADKHVGDADETTYQPHQVDASQVRVGTNVVAVEIHQDGAGSSDMIFDLELNEE